MVWLSDFNHIRLDLNLNLNEKKKLNCDPYFTAAAAPFIHMTYTNVPLVTQACAQLKANHIVDE